MGKCRTNGISYAMFRYLADGFSSWMLLGGSVGNFISSAHTHRDVYTRNGEENGFLKLDAISGGRIFGGAGNTSCFLAILRNLKSLPPGEVWNRVVLNRVKYGAQIIVSANFLPRFSNC